MMLEGFANYLNISDDFDDINIKIDAYCEHVLDELDMNYEASELKVMEESGTDADYEYLIEEAENGAVTKLSNALKKVIDAFKEFISSIKSKVVRLICNANTKTVLKKIEKKLRINPFLSKKKVKIIDKKKPLAVIAKYKSTADKSIAKIKAGAFAKVDITSISSAKDAYAHAYKAAIAGAAALTTVTVGNLVKMINKEYSDLPNHIDHIDKETTQVLRNLITSLDSEEAAAVKAAFTAAANFRTKLGKDETNEHVDAIMNKLSVLKKDALKIPDAKVVQVVNTNESYDDFDDFSDDFDMYGESYLDDYDYEYEESYEDLFDNDLDM